MKTLIFFLSILLFVSCNNDDDNSTETEQHEIVATWNLIRYEPGFSPTTNYTDEISWEFNPDNTINVNIVNGTEISNSMPLNVNGNYNYIINDNETIIGNITYNDIVIDGTTYDFFFVNEQLYIEDTIGNDADGRRLTFLKVE